MIEGLIQFIVLIVTKVANIIMLPFSLLLERLFPPASEGISLVKEFLNLYVFDNLLFVKQVMVNFGVPQIIFTFTIAYYGFLISMWAGGRIYLLVHRIYRNYKP